MYTSTTQQNVMSLRGLSTDTKPVDQMWLENGSVFLEMDTCKVFVYDGEHKIWIEQTDGGEGGDIVIDSELSSTSENPVQNKVIYGALQNKADIVNGKIPEAQLPSYVDDVIEGYYNSVDGKFYEHYESGTYSDEITPEDGKIYVDLTTNVTFRWSGNSYVQVGPNGDVVIANPTLAGTEDELTGLQVGNTKYKVPGGGGSGDKLYQHCVRFSYAGQRNIYVYFEFINTSNSMTASEVLTYISNLTNSDQHNVYPVSGTVNDTNITYPIAYCKFLSSKFTVYYVKNDVVYTKDFTLDDVTYDDAVTQIANAVNVAPSVELYEHSISIDMTGMAAGVTPIRIFNNSSEPINTAQKLIPYLDTHAYAISGLLVNQTGDAQLAFIFSIFRLNNTTYLNYYKTNNGVPIGSTGIKSFNLSTITDTVTKIL